MKKILFLLVFTFATSALQAQNGDMYSLLYHDMGGYGFGIESVEQQRNGDIIAVTHISQFPDFLGNIFFKMSPSSLSITDTLFVADALPPYYFYARDPNGEGNIRANLEYVEDVDSIFLRICHFSDDNLYINHNEDIIVPLQEGFAFDQFDGYLIDCRGDLIVKYSKERPNGGYNCHIARIDPAGTLKHQAVLFENVDYVIPKLRILKESPLQYYQWDGSPNENLTLFVIDSLFHTNNVSINRMLKEQIIDANHTVHEHLRYDNDTEVIPVGGDDILVAAQYVNDTNFYPMTAEYGVAVAKYDIRTMVLKDYIVFNDYPRYYHEARCLGLKMMTDGTVYFMYKEEGYPKESIVVVKMDANLNVEWKHFYKTSNIALSEMYPFLILYDDEQGEEKGIAWIGGGTNTNTNLVGLTYLFLNHDGPVNGVDEGSIEVRPYCFYPNPVQDLIHMQFSPDVQPKQIELYDLQGRLVRTQSKAFENIDMSQLPAGTYTMRVTLEDGKAYSDKVVKE